MCCLIRQTAATRLCVNVLLQSCPVLAAKRRRIRYFPTTTFPFAVKIGVSKDLLQSSVDLVGVRALRTDALKGYYFEIL